MQVLLILDHKSSQEPPPGPIPRAPVEWEVQIDVLPSGTWLFTHFVYDADAGRSCRNWSTKQPVAAKRF